MNPAIESSKEEVMRVRDSLNDLRGSLSVASIWTHCEPPPIVSNSLDALLGAANELEAHASNDAELRALRSRYESRS